MSISAKKLENILDKLLTYLSGGGCDKLVEQGLTANQVFNVALVTPGVNREKVILLSYQGMSKNAMAKKIDDEKVARPSNPSEVHTN